MKKALKQETIFYGVAKYANVFVTLLTSSVLARILSPAEFGVVSVVTVFTAFFAILSDMGLGTAVIQNKSLNCREIEDIFSFSVYIAAGLGILFALLGFFIVRFYDDTIYYDICMILSISVFFNAANVVPNAILMKEKRFKLVGKRLIVVSILTGVIAVSMALGGCSYYSIVFQSVIQGFLIFTWNYWNTKIKFHFFYHKESINLIKNYSSYQFFYSLINYFARNLDNLLIGKMLGSVSLAYYDKGYRLMMYPVQNLTYVINPILHPILSEYQNDKKYIYISYTKVVRILSLIGVFISFACFCCSQEIILLFFGNQWHASVPIFRILSLSVWPQMVSTSAGSIYQSSGNTKLMFKSGKVHFGLAIVLIVLGVLWGDLKLIAILVALSLYLRFFIDYYYLIVCNFKIKYSQFLLEFRVDVFIAVVLFATSCILNKVRIESIIISLGIKVGILSVLYLLLLIGTKQMHYLVSLVRRVK